jgi:hypothetical protein
MNKDEAINMIILAYSHKWKPARKWIVWYWPAGDQYVMTEIKTRPTYDHRMSVSCSYSEKAFIVRSGKKINWRNKEHWRNKISNQLDELKREYNDSLIAKSHICPICLKRNDDYRAHLRRAHWLWNGLNYWLPWRRSYYIPHPSKLIKDRV